VVIDVPNGAEVTQELLRRNFLVDYRPGAGIRVAPHFYSKDEELEMTVREMQAIVQEKTTVGRTSWSAADRPVG